MTTKERKRLSDAMMYVLDLLEDGHNPDYKINFVDNYINKVYENEQEIPVTRLEVINHANNDRGTGRLITLHKELGDFEVVELDYQDDGRTLKIFLA